MDCNFCKFIVFSERKIEGAKKIAEDSLHGRAGSLYLMDSEVTHLIGKGGVVTDGGRLATVI